MVACRRIDHGRRRRPLTQGRDAAHDVAGQALGCRGLEHASALGTAGRRERLEIQGAADRHDGDDGAPVDVRQQGLEDPARIDAQFLGGLEAEVGDGGIVVVGVHDMLDARALQRQERRGSGGSAPGHG